MRRLFVCVWLAGFVFCWITQGCFESGGGSNFNSRSAGNNNTGGVNVGGSKGSDSGGDIALDPKGEYALARVGKDLVHVDLATGKALHLPALWTPEMVAFAFKEGRYYLLSHGPYGRAVMAVDPQTNRALWGHAITDKTDTVRIYPSPDDSFLVVARLMDLEVLDTRTGEVLRDYHTDLGIRDVDIAPDSGEVLISNYFSFDNEQVSTSIQGLNPRGRGLRTIKVPNCMSNLVLSPDGGRAFLAPTICGKDPVSVIDLKAGKWERNLPGFGPVALSPDGTTAVAFLDAQDVDASLFDNKAQIPDATGPRYHLMFIDTATLKFNLVAVGENLPRYAMSRDGKVLLVDSIWLGAMERIRLLDIKARKIHEVAATLDMNLGHYVLHPNNQDVYLLDNYRLAKLSIPRRLISLFQSDLTPRSLNITPDGKRLLVLGWDCALHLVDTATEKVTGVINLVQSK